MNRYEAIEYLSQTMAETTTTERYKFLMACGCFDTESKIMDMAYWFSDRSQLPGKVLWQFNGILDFYRENRSITNDQKVWLLMSVVDNWQCLKPNARSEIQCLI